MSEPLCIFVQSRTSGAHRRARSRARHAASLCGSVWLSSKGKAADDRLKRRRHEAVSGKIRGIVAAGRIILPKRLPNVSQTPVLRTTA
jgi:hypothetical protein